MRRRDVHLDEVRAGDGVERHTGLTGAGAGQQGLAGTRRADEQHAVRDACAQRVELVGALEELHDLFQLFLLFVFTGHIGKGGGLLVLVLVLDLGFATFMMPPPPPTPPRIIENSKKPVQPSIPR